MTSALIPLVIVGAGGHGREALDIVNAINLVDPTYEMVGFVDDKRAVGEKAEPTQYPVIGGLDVLEEIDACYVLAIGLTDVRRIAAERLKSLGRGPVSLLHPSATMGSQITRGEGLVMAAGARLTHAVDLGDHVHLNVNSTVSHDCSIGSFVTITPGVHLSGNVRVGDGVWLGIGAVATQGVTIGADVTVGAGAVVIDDLPAGCTAVGVPARPLS